MQVQVVGRSSKGTWGTLFGRSKPQQPGHQRGKSYRRDKTSRRCQTQGRRKDFFKGGGGGRFKC